MRNYDRNTGLSSYNIDALRNEDGTYNLCTRRIASGALETPHVTHLQRADRIVAMRRTEVSSRDDKVLYTLDFSNRICQQFKDLSSAIDAVMDWLNDGEHGYEAGQVMRVHCNQAWREATVLAVIGDEILVEGEMPGTTSSWGSAARGTRHNRETTFLRRYNVALGDLRGMRSISYNSCPKKWLAAIDSQHGEWIGFGQRMTKPLSLSAALEQAS